MHLKSCPHCLRRKLLLWTGAFGFILLGLLGGSQSAHRVELTSTSAQVSR